MKNIHYECCVNTKSGKVSKKKKKESDTLTNKAIFSENVTKNSRLKLQRTNISLVMCRNKFFSVVQTFRRKLENIIIHNKSMFDVIRIHNSLL